MLAHYDKSVERMLSIWSFYGNEAWCMIGCHAVSVIADAMMKDVEGFDYEQAYEAMKMTASNPHYDCLPEYTALGWVPFDKEKESVSKSLEYAYDDYCVARVVEKLGKTEDFRFFMNRALSYKTERPGNQVYAWQGRIGAYWHGNEPCHQILYFYNYLKQPWKCQKRLRYIMVRGYLISWSSIFEPWSLRWLRIVPSPPV